MGEVSGEGRTVLLVSHNMASVTQLATQCLWLDRGQVQLEGLASDVISAYLADEHIAETDPTALEDI